MAFVWGSFIVFVGVILLLIGTNVKFKKLYFLQRMSIIVILIGLFLPYLISFTNQMLYQ